MHSLWGCKMLEKKKQTTAVTYKYELCILRSKSNCIIN